MGEGTFMDYRGKSNLLQPMRVEPNRVFGDARLAAKFVNLFFRI